MKKKLFINSLIIRITSSARKVIKGAVRNHSQYQIPPSYVLLVLHPTDLRCVVSQRIYEVTKVILRPKSFSYKQLTRVEFLLFQMFNANN